jgi:predicted site-specific integrase-resolvase
VKVSTLRSWVLHRKIPYVKLLGGRVFLRKSDLEKLIAESLVLPKARN